MLAVPCCRPHQLRHGRKQILSSTVGLLHRYYAAKLTSLRAVVEEEDDEVWLWQGWGGTLSLGAINGLPYVY